MKSEILKTASAVIIQVLIFATLIAIGYSIENVDDTWYPSVMTAFIIYVGVGDLVMLSKGIDAPESSRIMQGRLHLRWGLVHYWWVLWWPRLIRKR